MKKANKTKDKKKIESFTDLHAWQEGHELVLAIYRITKDFPDEEKFGLVIQMRRCAVSITSNIAEGFSRKSYKEKARFYSMAISSATELQNQPIISKDVDYISEKQFKELSRQFVVVHKLLNGLIKASNNIHNS